MRMRVMWHWFHIVLDIFGYRRIEDSEIQTAESVLFGLLECVVWFFGSSTQARIYGFFARL